MKSKLKSQLTDEYLKSAIMIALRDTISSVFEHLVGEKKCQIPTQDNIMKYASVRFF